MQEQTTQKELLDEGRARRNDVAVNPRVVKEIRGFIGLVGYYRKFIKDFAKIEKPLTLLTWKEISFVLSEDQQEAFELESMIAGL